MLGLYTQKTMKKEEWPQCLGLYVWQKMGSYVWASYTQFYNKKIGPHAWASASGKRWAPMLGLHTQKHTPRRMKNGPHAWASTPGKRWAPMLGPQTLNSRKTMAPLPGPLHLIKDGSQCLGSHTKYHEEWLPCMGLCIL